MFFEIGVPKSYSNFTRKHLCWSLQAEGLQLYQKKKTPTQVFSCEVYKIFKESTFYRTPPVTASALQVAASVFLLKK